jgi:hypothetical protein
MIVAAPAPWIARALISQVTSVASAHAAEPAANSSRPIASSRRRPKRSPRAAAVISRTAKLSVYALTVHSSCASEEPRCRRMLTRAVDTTSMSRTTMNDATDARARTHF